jgi:hypothetical protein
MIMAGTIMRITIDIPDQLYKQVKARAALQGLTVKEIVLKGIEREMRDTPVIKAKKKRIQLPLIHGKGTRKIDLTNVDMDEIIFGCLSDR